MQTSPGPRIEEIVDTHLHLVDRGRLSYPWLDSTPPLDRDWPLADYASEARPLGIARALHMEVDVAEADITVETDWIETLIDEGGFPIAGIIAACRPEAEDFPAELERATARRHVVGLRRVLHVVPDALSETDRFRANVARLGSAGLPFDLCVAARQLPLAIALADAAPDTRFVLDHCGVPDIAGGAWESWAENINEIARRPNVCAKISGVIAYAAQGWHPGEIARWVNHVTGAFGYDRLCWGGDWPVCTLGGGLSVWVATSRAIFAQASVDERARLWSGTAHEIWGV